MEKNYLVTDLGSVRFWSLGVLFVAVCLVDVSAGQASGNAAPILLAPAAVNSTAPGKENAPAHPDQQQSPQLSKPQSALSQHDQAEQQLKQEEQQRILRVVPNFNTSYIQNAAPLSPGQKFRLALRSCVDPFQFVAAGFNAGISQWQNSFPGYGQGAQGYFKRFGASYADQFSGTIWGNAVFPVLLHEDPRYFRKGTGTFKSRLFYALLSNVKTKNDDGTWGPNYANLLGNIAAGGLANLYYPATDRGAGLTFERAFILTAEGAIGSVFVEFWPEISHRVFHHKQAPRGISQ